MKNLAASLAFGLSAAIPAFLITWVVLLPVYSIANLPLRTECVLPAAVALFFGVMGFIDRYSDP